MTEKQLFMTEEVELFEYLSAEYTDVIQEDLKFCEPNDENNKATDFQGNQHLAKEYYVCCEQKIIWWDKDAYRIACLYNSHPNMRYETKEEVRDFLLGNNHSPEATPFLTYQTPAKSAVKFLDESKAYNDGLFCWFYAQICMGIKEFQKNAFVFGGVGTDNIVFRDFEESRSLDLANLKIKP